MALQTTINTLKDLLSKISHDLNKAEGGNKAASQRVRTMTVRLEKIAKGYRKESITSEKQNKGMKKTKKTTTKAKAKPLAKKPAVKAKPKAKSASAKPRAFSFKKPTAKLPIRRPNFR